MSTQNSNVIWRIHYAIKGYTISPKALRGGSLTRHEGLRQTTETWICILSTVKVKLTHKITQGDRHHHMSWISVNSVLHGWLTRKTRWDFSITRSVNTPLPAPWQHSWECRMFTCLETVYLTTSNTSFLHLICYISNGLSPNVNMSVLFSPCKMRLLKAMRSCKHPTESPHSLNPSFQSRMFTAPPGCQ